MDIARYIRARREALALTQTDAAKRLGVTLRTWQRWEQPGSTAALPHLDRLAEGLDSTPAGLLGLEAAPTAPGSVEERLGAVEAQLLELTSALRALASDPRALARAADELLEQELSAPGNDAGADARGR